MARVKRNPIHSSHRPQDMPSTSNDEPTHEVNSKKRRRQLKPGQKCLKEIIRLQNSTQLIIPKTTFLRLVREIALDVMNGKNLLWQREAVEALQEIAEVFLISLFEDANAVCAHSKRVTVRPNDMRLCQRLRGDLY